MAHDGDDRSKSTDPAHPAPVLDYFTPQTELHPFRRDIAGAIFSVVSVIGMIGLCCVMLKLLVVCDFSVFARIVFVLLLLLFFLLAAWAGGKLARRRFSGTDELYNKIRERRS